MSNTILEEKQVCTCGRAFSHCLHCGSKNIYPKKMRSFEVSDQVGKRIYVFGCRRCMRESLSEGQECKAPMRDFNPAYIAEIKSPGVTTKPKLLGDAVPGSSEHHVLLNDWIKEHSGRGLTSVQLYIEAQKAGWNLEAFGDAVESGIRQALTERGLWKDSKDAGVKEQSGTPNASGGAESSNETQASLDEIIKAMNEEQK